MIKNKNPFFILYLSGLSMLGYLATDMYLPAFSIMQDDLNTSASVISGSLSIYLGGFALGQLIWGELSDNLGRRRALLMGLLVFIVGCIGVLFVDGAAGLLFCRFLQAIGVCATAVIWQALVVDRYGSENAHKVFAVVMPLVALSPALAPIIGAWLIAHYPWRAIFLVLAAITFALIVFTALLKNKNKQSAESNTHRIKLPLADILRSRVFIGNVMMYSSSSAAFFCWLGGSPFILTKMGYGADVIGLSFLPQTIAFLIGGYGCRTLVNYFDKKTVLTAFVVLFCVSLVALFGIAVVGNPALSMLLGVFSLMAMANAAIFPLVVANALAIFPNNTGKASALFNAIQLTGCFIATLLVSVLVQNPLIGTISMMLCMVPMKLLGYYVAHRGKKCATSEDKLVA
jgi:Bcr/CflA subfamily drug resistance transporter